MPKETYFNLPEQKRTAICQVAIAEFAAHPFEQASINRIVAEAGIAKGSFYQYFENKKDLFFYLIQLVGEKKFAFLAPVLQDADAYDFFSLMRALYVAGIQFARENPEFAAMSKKVMANKGAPIYEEIMASNMPSAYDFFETLLEKAVAQGDVRADVDIKLFAYLIASLNTLVLEYYTEHVSSDYDEKMLTTVDQFIDFLSRGIGASPIAAPSHAKGASP